MTPAAHPKMHRLPMDVLLPIGSRVGDLHFICNLALQTNMNINDAAFPSALGVNREAIAATGAASNPKMNLRLFINTS